MSPQKFETKVLGKQYLTDDVILLKLSKPDNFTFKAGQFITLKITNNNQTKPRSYSILNPPNSNTLELCIKIVQDGFASQIFKDITIGQTLPAIGPLGHFVFEDDQVKEHIFIGTGTGVAPLYSMILQHLNQDKKFTLIFGVRHLSGLFLHQLFQQLQRSNSNFTYIPTLTRDSWPHATGRVQTHLPKDLTNKAFYICGLKEMVLETKQTLEKANVPKNLIHFERYS